MPTQKTELILKLIQDVYYEDERRNSLIDTKNSQMILVTSIYFILHSSLTGYFIIQLNNGVLSLLFLISLILIIASLTYTIQAFCFKNDYYSAPSQKYLEYAYEKEKNYNKFIESIFKAFSTAINHNSEIMNTKLKKGKKGIYFFIISLFSCLINYMLLIFLMV